LNQTVIVMMQWRLGFRKTSESALHSDPSHRSKRVLTRLGTTGLLQQRLFIGHVNPAGDRRKSATAGTGGALSIRLTEVELWAPANGNKLPLPSGTKLSIARYWKG
jgi:hypothetical protein